MNPRMSILMAACLGLAACGDFEADVRRPAESLSRKVPRGQAAEVDVHIEMAAGELQVSSGGRSGDLLDGHFQFNHDSGKPNVTYSEAAGRGRLNVEPVRRDSAGGNARWELRLAEGIATRVTVRMGAGKAQLELGSLDLRGLSLNGGAGDLTLDLRGRPTADYDVQLNGGVGRMRIYVPGIAGVVARVNGGIGGVDTEGDWKKSGREYRTANYDDAKRRIEMRVNGGIGTIKLIADE